MLRSPQQERKTQAGGPGLSKDENHVVGKFLLPFLAKTVNDIHIAGLLFGRDLLLAGLACLGWPWSRRLSLWLDWLDQEAEALRERMGVRT
jgi:hypothetical protein